MRKSLYILMLFVLSATSCIYDYDPVIVDADTRIVIEGDIIIGGETQIMTSYMMALDKSDVQHPRGIAWVEDSKGGKYYDSSILPASHNRGYYFTIDTRMAPMDGRQYRLCFQDEDHHMDYASAWVTPIQAPKVSKIFHDIDGNSVNIRLNIDGGKDVGYFRWDYKETWRYHAEYVPDYVFNPRTGTVTEVLIPSYDTYYCWASGSPTEFGLADSRNNGSSTVKGQVVTTIQRTSPKMQMMYRMNLTVRGMSKDSYTYHHNMLTISDLTGSLFTASPDDMHGNIVCTSDTTQFVIGFVEAVQLTKKTYYMDPLKSGAYKTPRSTPMIDPNSREGVTLFDWWEMGYVPIADTNIDGVDCIGWAEKRCVDCALLGGTYQEPEDWDPYSVLDEYSSEGMK